MQSTPLHDNNYNNNNNDPYAPRLSNTRLDVFSSGGEFSPGKIKLVKGERSVPSKWKVSTVRFEISRGRAHLDESPRLGEVRRGSETSDKNGAQSVSVNRGAPDTVLIYAHTRAARISRMHRIRERVRVHVRVRSAEKPREAEARGEDEWLESGGEDGFAMRGGSAWSCSVPARSAYK